MKVIDSFMKLQEQHVAIGRLGKIYKAHDYTSGGLVTVEQINLKQWEENPNATEEMGIKWQNKLAKAKKLLKNDLENIKSIEHPHVFQYKNLVCQQDQISIVSQNAAGGPLSVMLRGFGKLHHTVVRRYMQAILFGLITLHEADIVYGGLSTSSIFICHNTVKLACYFPSKITIKQILESEILADTQCARLFLQRSVDGNEILQDIRSIAYIMIELLSGSRVRGNSVERAYLLQQLDEESIEYSFLNELLLYFGSSTPRSLCGKSFIKNSLQALVDHPYVNISTSHIFSLPLRFASGATSMSNSNCTFIAKVIKDKDVSTEEPEIVGLTQKELEKCHEQKKTLLVEIRQWFSHFERKQQRKPRMNERPASILRLQARTRTLEERIQDLETRLTIFNESFSKSKEINTREEKAETIEVREVEQAMKNNTRNDSMISEAKSSAGTVSTIAPSSVVGSLKGGRPTNASLFAMELHAIDVEPHKNEKESINSMGVATPKRSPAQKAFLKRLSVSPDRNSTLENAVQMAIQQVTPGTPSSKAKNIDEEDLDEDEDDESSRKYAEAHKNGKKLMQQRRDLSIILNALEDPAKVSPSRKQSREV